MIKHSKLVYIMGSIIIGIITMLAIVAGLIITGVWDGAESNLVFTSASETRVYNGEELVNHSWKLESGSLKKGHTVNAVVTGSQTDAGQSENAFVIYIKDRNGADVTEDYSIICNPGMLTVQKQQITVTTSDDSKDYDGKPLSAQEKHVTISTGIAVSQKPIILLGEKSITEPGSISNMATIKIVDEADENVDRTHNYDIKYEYGTLSINKIELLLVTGSTTRMYNGQPQKYENYNVTNKFLDGHKIDPTSVIFTCEQIDVGTYSNTIDEKALKIVDNSGEDVSHFYDVSMQYGKLIIYHITIEVRTLDATKPYDGTPLTKDGYLLGGEMVEGHKVLVNVTGTITFPGQANNTFLVTNIVDSNGESVAHNYKVNHEYGLLVITGIISSPITFPENTGGIDKNGGDYSTSDASAYQVLSNYGGKVYLKQVSFGDYIVSGEGSAWGEDYSYLGTTYDPLQFSYYAQSGSVKTATIKKLIDDAPYVYPYYSDYTTFNSIDQLNYSINFIPFAGNTYQKDLLKNTSYQSLESAYRAFAYQNYLDLPSSTYKAMQSVIVSYNLSADDEEIINKVARLVQNYVNYNTVFSFEGDVAAEFFNGAKGAICQHYATAATALFRAIGIPARYVIGFADDIVANQETIISFPGHAWVEVYVDGSGWMPVEVTGSGNTLPDDDNDGSGGVVDVKAYFIKPYDIYLEGDMSSVISGYTYDTLQGNDFNALCEENNYTYQFTVDGYQRGIGKSLSKITSFHLFDEEGNDITNNYKYNINVGIMHVYVQELTLTTAGLSEFYDGRDHYINVSHENYSIDYGRWGRLIDGHVIANIDFGAKIREVGTIVNSVRSFSIVDYSGTDVTDFYKINYVYGKLVIKPREIVITAGSMTVAYSTLNGGELTCSDYVVEKYIAEITGEALASGHTITVEVTGSLSSPGRVSNIVTSFTIKDALGDDVLKNYKVHTVDGKLSVYMD